MILVSQFEVVTIETGHVYVKSVTKHQLFKCFIEMLDLTDNLNSLGFEAGLSEDEKELLYLRSRSAGLTVSGCAHAVFVYELFRLLR